jgi:outer membrane lipoprotein SlyB
MNKLIPMIVSLGLLSGCATDSGYSNDRYSSAYDRDNRYVRCDRCGEVTRIERFEGERRSSGGGAVVGAVVGGVLGSNVGSGDGRRAATVAGAVVGGIAGNEIERNRNGRDVFELTVRMDDGRRVRIEQRDLSGIREGDRVIVDGGRARLM